MVEVFYFPEGGHAAAGRSVSARVAPGEGQTVRMALPALAGRTAFRIDPPGTGGKAVVAWLRVSPRLSVPEPKWPSQAEPRPGGLAATLVVRSGGLSLVHDGSSPGGFELKVEGDGVAAGMGRSLLGYVVDGTVRWAQLPAKADVRIESDVIEEASTWRDPDGAAWRLTRRYAPGKSTGTIDVVVDVRVDRDRDVLFLPALVLLPGVGSFGQRKTQALFPGLEYLDAGDASSSELDVTGPASRRRVPSPGKVTFPLMALCADGKYIALTWERDGPCSGLFDSPDCTFHAGGHVTGLVFPGGAPRVIGDGDLLPGETQTLKANQPLTVRATFLGGVGESVVPAVRQYIGLRGLPTIPQSGLDAKAYCQLAAGGWLDSALREGARVRHAVWPGFGAQPAADAAVWMSWLAGRVDDGTAARCRQSARAVLGGVPPEQLDASHVGHITYPAMASLVFGHVHENAAAAEARGRALLKRFQPDGTVHYRPVPGREDFGRTHTSRDANGLTAAQVVRVLQSAAVSGKEDLVRESLRLLRGLGKFRNTVPRGAQTWEVPLHTPDILAAAHLVRAYLLGYELTGDAELLEQAKYWAWTGLPFVYLDDPTGKPVGSYATVPVFGASDWTNAWFGRPVQWCGLVYADALYDLHRFDAAGPWKTVADGITTSGVQQSWPASDTARQGLLPDFYHLSDQARDGPAINPGTLQACAARLHGDGAVYGFHCFRGSGVMVHAPGPVQEAAQEGTTLRFVTKGWPAAPYHVLVSGLRSAPIVRVDGRVVGAGEDYQYAQEAGRLVLRVRGSPRIDMDFR